MQRLTGQEVPHTRTPKPSALEGGLPRMAYRLGVNRVQRRKVGRAEGGGGQGAGGPAHTQQ